MELPVMVTTHAPEDTEQVAARLAALCNAGDCVRLIGDLGAGKTTFARGFIHALCGKAEEVVSPTFTLAQTYVTRDGRALWHFDFYRIKSSEELKEVGLEDALATGISLIEWPEIADAWLPKHALTVALAAGADPASRVISITSGR